MDTTLPHDLWSLVKPRIVALLCVTGLFSLLAAGGAPPVATGGFLVAGGCIAASAAAFNCWYDRGLDRHMERTADRPLPSGRLDHRVAAAFATLLLGLGTLVGIATLPAEAVGYMLLGFASYVGLYTVLLKRRHWLGVVLGGSAGSFPVLAGWTTVRPLAPEALLLALVVFVWTPAHAWALASVYRADFAAAGVPTLPVVAPPSRVRRGVRYSVLATVAVAACAVPFVGPPYPVAVLVGGSLFVLGFRRFYRAGGDRTAVRAFFTSNLFLALLFGAWGVSGVVTGPALPVRVVVALAVPVLFVGLWAARPTLRGVRAAVGWERRVIRWLRDRTLAGIRKHVRDNDHPGVSRSGD